MPIVDPPTAEVVKRIFTMHSQGISPRHIADKLNEEKVPIPSDYLYVKLGKPNHRNTKHLWCAEVIRQILHNPTYLGDLVQMKTTTISYKVYKSFKRDEEDWIVIPNTHEAIVSRDLWDKCREVDKSVSQGKRNKDGYVASLSGLMFCAACGGKMRIGWNNTRHQRSGPREYYRHNFNCNTYNKFGMNVCESHHIRFFRIPHEARLSGLYCKCMVSESITP